MYLLLILNVKFYVGRTELELKPVLLLTVDCYRFLFFNEIYLINKILLLG